MLLMKEGANQKPRKKSGTHEEERMRVCPGRKERDSSLGYTTHSRTWNLETTSQEIVCCLLRTFGGKWLLCDLCKSKGVYQRNTWLHTIPHPKGNMPAVPLSKQRGENISEEVMFTWSFRWCYFGWAFLNLVCVVLGFFVFFLFFWKSVLVRCRQCLVLANAVAEPSQWYRTIIEYI